VEEFRVQTALSVVALKFPLLCAKAEVATKSAATATSNVFLENIVLSSLMMELSFYIGCTYLRCYTYSLDMLARRKITAPAFGSEQYTSLSSLLLWLVWLRCQPGTRRGPRRWTSRRGIARTRKCKEKRIIMLAQLATLMHGPCGGSLAESTPVARCLRRDGGPEPLAFSL